MRVQRLEAGEGFSALDCAVDDDVLPPDPSVNDDLRRLSAWSTPRGRLHLARTARDKPHLADLSPAFLACGEELLAQGHRLDGAFCLRAAEYFMAPAQARQLGLRDRFVSILREVYGVRPDQIHAIPYGRGELAAYDFGRPNQGTVVLQGGMAAHIEEMFPFVRALTDAGYRVIAFEGPGQGGPLEEWGMPLEADWHKPMGALLDWFDLDDVTVIGMSLGSLLAIRVFTRAERAASHCHVTNVALSMLAILDWLDSVSS